MNIEKLQEFLKKHKNTIKSLADLSNIFQSIAALFTILGILFVGLEYHTQKKTNREEKAFELYQQFNEGVFIASRNNLKQAYYNKREENPDFQKDTKSYIETMEPLWDENYVDLISIKDFFEQVATCVEQKLCDDKVTEALFYTEAEEFLQTHYQFFCFEREKHGDKEIGKILERFLEKTNSDNSRNCDHIKDYLEVEVTTNNVY